MGPLIDEKDVKQVYYGGRSCSCKAQIRRETNQIGIALPLNVHEKEKVYSGYVVKVGLGYPIPAVAEDDEPWKSKS